MPDNKSAFCQKCSAWYGQLGLESTLDMYIKHLLLITVELKRVLKPTGVMWWNHGDCYGGSGCGKGDYREKERLSISKLGQYTNKPNPQLQMTPKCLALQNYRLLLRMIDDEGDDDYELRPDLSESEKKYVIDELKKSGIT